MHSCKAYTSICCLSISSKRNDVKTTHMKTSNEEKKTRATCVDACMGSIRTRALKQNRRSAIVTVIMGTTAMHETDKYCQL